MKHSKCVFRLRRSQSSRSGITVVEVLVATAIVSLLFAIILPAVQSTRERARALSCQNNLRQLGLAAALYHDSYQTLPPIGVPASVASGALWSEDGFTFLFNFVELAPRSSLIDAGVSRLPLLECPSDPDLASIVRPVSYAENISPGIGSGSRFHGPFGPALQNTVPFAMVTDGLSSTVAFSEKVVFRAGGTTSDEERQPTHYLSIIGAVPLSTTGNTSMYSVAQVNQTETSISLCLNGPRGFHQLSQAKFATWDDAIGPSSGPGTYSHWLPPNSPYCSTGLGCSTCFIDVNTSAASNHAGGVNVVFLDGHVRFVTNLIDLNVWRAIGTIDGNETVNEGL